MDDHLPLPRLASLELQSALQVEAAPGHARITWESVLLRASVHTRIATYQRKLPFPPRTMDSRNLSTGGESIDWNDPLFQTSNFEDSMNTDSPYASNAFTDFTNLDGYGDSPGVGMRTPSKSGPAATAGAQQPAQTAGQASSASAESSSQDSASDSSSHRKRKVTSESPMSDGQQIKQETLTRQDTGNMQRVQTFDQNFTRPMHDLSLEHEERMSAPYDYTREPSSPLQSRDFNPALSLNQHVHIPSSGVGSRYHNSPVMTVNPGMFQIGGSQGGSPVNNNMVYNASPNNMFSTPSSDSNETFNGNPTWHGNMAQNPAWPTDFNNQFASPNGMGFTPSPVVKGATPAVVTRGAGSAKARSPLHIAPISTKSRVETQINILMTLEKPPPNIENLHLPVHTIAKSKLLAKDEGDPATTLELHTMLVCTSAMHNTQFMEKALQRAACQNNKEIARRAETHRELSDEDKNNMRDVEEADKPANGGEVRICQNCIQRERKRAGRKKLKKEEEQEHWERHETERVVVFNSTEYLPWKPYDKFQQGADVDDQSYTPPDGSMQVTAAMRIACYCRHQSEKEGFRVIFTLKNHQGQVVAQQMSDSILITDDHKTHPPGFAAGLPGDVFFQTTPYGNGAPNGLPTSYSMVDMGSHAQPFPSSRSTGNLHAMWYGQQGYNPHSHVHQMPNSGYASQTTSATMTPTNLSRPASPTNITQAGPNKKRKSSTFHRRIPSGLTMTPRVDTSQAPASGLVSGMPMTSPFSPNGSAGYSADGSYMTIPTNSGPAQYYGSGPPTPSENAPFAFHQPQIDMARAQNAQAYFSHPSSAVPSRANSPVLSHSRPNMAAYARQPQPVQTATNSMQGRQAMYAQQLQQAQQAQQAALMGPGSTSTEGETQGPPTITKITPCEGPVSGGTEVSIYGYNFTNGMQVRFGEQIAVTVFYGAQALLATSPPSRQGGVNVSLVLPGVNEGYTASSNRQLFTYKDTDPRMMEMALRMLSQQQNGNQVSWNHFANQAANSYLQKNIGQAGIRGQGYEGGNMMSAGPVEVENMVLHIFDLLDNSETPRIPCYDSTFGTGNTMLTLASALGMHKVAAALLARGANPDMGDVHGWTPSMHAALHGHTKIFHLLLIRGADPSIRSLAGNVAIELAPDDKVEQLQQILLCTPRSRQTRRPSLHPQVSLPSSISWDMSSASYYDSEADSASLPPSRRPSVPMLLLPPSNGAHEDLHISPASMMDWRDALSAQIQHFQRSMHRNMPHFQLPALPPLPDYHDSAMVRRLSSLVPGRTSPRLEVSGQGQQQQHRFWDIFSAQHAACAVPPPSYTELFPEGKDVRDAVSVGPNPATKAEAAAGVVADQKFVLVCEKSTCGSTSTLSDGTERQHPVRKLNEEVGLLNWLWVCHYGSIE